MGAASCSAAKLHLSVCLSVCLSRGRYLEQLLSKFEYNKYVSPPCCRIEMYDGGVACCPLVSRGEYANGKDGQADRRTDGRTPDRYVTLSTVDAASVRTIEEHR